MISIELNKKLDYEMYKDFCNLSNAGADFAALIKKDHPLITLENSEKYIDDFYNENATAMEQSRDNVTEALHDKQKEFFEVLKSLFKTDFTSNNYKGYISIFDCNPRFVETNEFQVFYKRSTEGKLAVVFHEVLHFAFFEYCDAHFSKQLRGLDKNSGKLWGLSEIFNVIILNTPQFANIIGGEEKLFYPQLSEKLAQAKIVWDKVSRDVDKFINTLIEPLF